MTTKQHIQIAAWKEDADRLRGLEPALREIIKNPDKAEEIAREALGEESCRQ